MAQIYFGNVLFADWIQAPDSGMSRTNEGYAEEIALDNGGLYIATSAQTHSSYDMNFRVADTSVKNSVELLDRFAAGEFGNDFLRFIDPMRQDENLFSRVWAAPGLSEQGWKPICDGSVTYSSTSTNSYAKPLRKATYALSGGVIGGVPTGQNSVFTILIPPTYTLSLGGSGSVSNAALRVQPINLDGSLAATVDITLTSDATAPAFSRTFAGTTYKAVQVYATPTSLTAPTITLTSLWAQCLPTGTTPVISRHIPGKGHGGLKFRGNARQETYVMTKNHKVSYAATVAEVEAWH